MQSGDCNTPTNLDIALIAPLENYLRRCKDASSWLVPSPPDLCPPRALGPWVESLLLGTGGSEDPGELSCGLADAAVAPWEPGLDPGVTTACMASRPLLS